MFHIGILKTRQKAKKNAFYRGIPFIWCSNNLTASFTIQCCLYRTLSGDDQYAELEQAGFDWLFGCNPWGKAMVYGLPAGGNTPLHPHSSLYILNNYDLDGAMVDGRAIRVNVAKPKEDRPKRSFSGNGGGNGGNRSFSGNGGNGGGGGNRW